MQVGSEDRCSSPELLEFESDDDPEEIDVDGIVVPPSHIVNERAVRLEQLQAGQVLFSPKSNKLLSDMLDEVYGQLQPKRADWDARQSVIHFITKFVNHKIPGSSISAFGSFVMDLFTSSSDLDLSLNLSDGRLDRTRNDKVHYLRKVAKALYGLQNGLRQSVQKIETVYRAAVPVVKFVEYKTGIECDISVENNDGVLKSRVLGMFSTMDSRFRQLCYLVKAWAKKHNVNSSKNGTLNSLSICLLVAFHLQTCQPPILPPFSVFMEGLDLPSIESCLRTVESRVRAYKDSGFGKDNTRSVPELFASFFLKLIAVESLWGQGLCSSTYEGKWIAKIWPKNHIGCISVEDFADRTQNVARSVSRKEFEMIYNVLQSTVSNLKEPVGDVLEAKDLRSYLFGTIRQRHRGTDYDSVTSNSARWSSANGWSSGDKRANVTTSNGRGRDTPPENFVYNDGGSWGQKASPVHLNRPQAGSRHAPRANGYRKVDQSARVSNGDPSFDARGSGDYRGLYHHAPAYEQYVQYPPPNSRSIPTRDVKQPSLYQSMTGYGKDDYASLNDGRYVHRDVDFPRIDADTQYSDGAGVGYPFTKPVQSGRMTYASVGSNSRPRTSQPASYQAVPNDGHQQQHRGPQKSKRNQRNRTSYHQGPHNNAAQRPFGANGYPPVHREQSVQWPVQPSVQ